MAGGVMVVPSLAGFLALTGIALIVWYRFKTWVRIIPVLAVYYLLTALMCLAITLDVIFFLMARQSIQPKIQIMNV